jgi:hypothetical protein
MKTIITLLTCILCCQNYFAAATTPPNNPSAFLAEAFMMLPPDTDGDGIDDHVDLDSDNDGILDTEEGCTVIPSLTAATNWTVTSPTVATRVVMFEGNPVTITATLSAPLGGSGGTFTGTNHTGSHNLRFSIAASLAAGTSSSSLLTLTSTNNDLPVNMEFTDFDNIAGYYQYFEPITQAYTAASPSGWTSSTGTAALPGSPGNLQHSNEDDSDNDGADGVFALGGSFPFQLRIGASAYVTGTGSSANMGIDVLGFESKDTDNDSIADHLDLDSDNDGCPDTDEAYGASGTDTNSDGTYGGIVAAYDAMNPTNLAGVNEEGLVNAAGITGSAYNTLPATAVSPAIATYLVATEASVDATALISKVVADGASTTFAVTSATATSTQAFSGTAPATTPDYTTSPTDVSTTLSYQWQENGVDLTNTGVYTNTSGTGATPPVLNISNVTGLQGTTYTLVVTHPDNTCIRIENSAKLELDSDNDGIRNSADLDSDNDGILNSDECPVPAFSNSNYTTINPATFGITSTSTTNSINVTEDVSHLFGLPIGSVIVSVIDGNAVQNVNGSVGFRVAEPASNTRFEFSGTVPVFVRISHGSVLKDLGDRDGFIDLGGVTYTQIGAVEPGYGFFNSGSNYFCEVIDESLADFTQQMIWFSNAPTTGVDFYTTDNSTFGSAMSFQIAPCPDSDKDGIPDHLDSDSDNDGIPDLVEAGGVDTNGDGMLDDNTDTDGDGIADSVDNDDTDGPTGSAPTGVSSTSVLTDPSNSGTSTAVDSDNDGVPDYADLDSDNDGIPDVEEAGGTDANGDGRLDGFVDADGDGLNDLVDGDPTNSGTPTNTANALVVTGPDTDMDGQPNSYVAGDADGDGYLNFKDLDADNDGITDLVEVGGVDANGDGLADNFVDADGDGFNDDIDSDPNNELTPGSDTPGTNPSNGLLLSGADLDTDGLDNYLDLDADNDGIADNIEAVCTGCAIALTGLDDNMNGVDNAFEGLTTGNVSGGSNLGLTPVVTTDVVPDYLSIDTDGDGAYDWSEAFDANMDGEAKDDFITMAEAYETANSTPNHYNTTDGDGDGIPDWLDNLNGPGVTESTRPPFLDPATSFWLDSNDNGIADLVDAAITGSSPAGLQDTDSMNDADWRDTNTSAPLPITLLSFTASTHECDIIVNWSATDAVDFDYFEVEKATGTENFTAFAKTAPASETTEAIPNYDAVLPNTQGLTYLRLKMVDLDGTIAYSETIVVNADCNATTPSMYPNPVVIGNAVTIENEVRGEVILSDITGRTIFQTTVESGEIFILDTSGLQPGVFFVTSANGQAQQLFVR